MDSTYTRCRALELALAHSDVGDDVIKLAQTFYEFLSGNTEASGQYSFHLGEQG